MIGKVQVLSEHKRGTPPHCKVVLRNPYTPPAMTSEPRRERWRAIDNTECSKQREYVTNTQRRVWGAAELKHRVCRLVIIIRCSSYPACTGYYCYAKWMVYIISFDSHSIPQMRQLRWRKVMCFAHHGTAGKRWSQKLMCSWLASQSTALTPNSHTLVCSLNE